MTNYNTPTEEMFEKIHDKISELALNVKTKHHLDAEDVFFDTEELLKLMNISKRTAQVWRDTKIIGFSQIGNKIYYKLTDIQKLLKENYHAQKSNHKQS